MDLHETKALMSFLAEEYPKFKVTDERILNWSRALRDYSFSTTRTAIDKVYQTQYRSKTEPPNITEILGELKKHGAADREAYETCLKECKTWDYTGGLEGYERPFWREDKAQWEKRRYVRAKTRPDLGPRVLCSYTNEDGEKIVRRELVRDAIHLGPGKGWVPKIEFILSVLGSEAAKQFTGWHISELMTDKAKAEEYFTFREALLDEAMARSSR